MRHLRQVGAGLALLLVGSSVALAQRTPARSQASNARLWELGADAALRFGLDDPNTTTLDIVDPNFRLGYFFNSEWSFEPFLALSYVDNELLADPITQYTIGASALYHFQTVRTRRQLYVRPFLAIVGASAGGNSDTDTGFGAGVGLKWPRWNGRLALRGEANLARYLDAEQTVVSATFGVSLFNR